MSVMVYGGKTIDLSVTPDKKSATLIISNVGLSTSAILTKIDLEELAKFLSEVARQME